MEQNYFNSSDIFPSLVSERFNPQPYINTTHVTSYENQESQFSNYNVIQDNYEYYKFFYRPSNDFQIYHITCVEMSFELISQLLNNPIHNVDIQSNNLYTFYYQQPNNKKIYKVVCEIVSHTFIVQLLNNIHYGVETNLSKQQQDEYLDFSNNHKENLELYLKQYLIDYLSSNQINRQLNMNTDQDNFIYEDVIITPQQDVNQFSECN